MTSTGARIRVVAFLAIIVLGSVIDTTRRPMPTASAAEAQRDIELFRAVVARVRAGTRYYEAMGTELRARRYPAASVFNWRTPLLYTAVAAIGPASARVLLISLASALVVLTVVVLRTRSTPALMAALFMQFGAFVSVAVPSAPFLTEVWAGVLLGLSYCAYQMRVWRTAAVLALIGLFIRELAAPYVVVCAWLALHGRRRHEVAVWIAGAATYSIYFAWHLYHVKALQEPGDLAHAFSWLYGGGPIFLLQTLRTNAWVFLASAWIPTAPALLAILLAACAWPGTTLRLRGIVTAYLAMFLVVGQPFNQYWGLLTAPLWAVATADGVEALRHWLAIATQPPRSRAAADL